MGRTDPASRAGYKARGGGVPPPGGATGPPPPWGSLSSRSFSPPGGERSLPFRSRPTPSRKEPQPPIRYEPGGGFRASWGAPFPAFAGSLLLQKTVGRGRAAPVHHNPASLGRGKNDIGKVHDAREMADTVSEHGEAMVFAVDGDGHRNLRIEPLVDLPAGGKFQKLESRFLAEVRHVLEEAGALRGVRELVQQQAQLSPETLDPLLEGGEVLRDNFLLLDLALEFCA